MDPDITEELQDLRSAFEHSVFAHKFQFNTQDELIQFVRTDLGTQEMDAHTIKSFTKSVKLGESIIFWNGTSLQYKDGIESQTAQSLCRLMCGDETVTPTRSQSMMNALHLTDLLMMNALELTDILVTSPYQIAPIFNDGLREAASEWHEEALFKSHCPTDDCPICFLPLPFEMNKISLRSCCGKILCLGCIWGVAQEGSETNTCPCPFCRAEPYKSNDEYLQWLTKLIKKKHTLALTQLGSHYYVGHLGLTRDPDKAFKLWTEAGEEGGDHGNAYYHIATSYFDGMTGIFDGMTGKEFHKVQYYYEKAAIQGDVQSRYLLGKIEKTLENKERSAKHFILAAEAGHQEAMTAVMESFKNEEGQITKDDLTQLLRKHHETKSSMESEAREKGESVYRQLGLTNGVFEMG